VRASACMSSMVVLACAAADARAVPPQTPTPAPPPAQVVHVGGEIKEPTKLKSVAPVYPEAAKQARVQGVVILECTISPRGDVVDVKVLRGIPLLDQAAVDAVRQWVYTPTLLNGVPVPVIMTVTVNFKLSGGTPSAEPPPNVFAPAPVATGPPEKLADIRRLLELNGSRATTLKAIELMLAAVRTQARPETPPELWDAFEQELKAEHMEDWAVPIYDRHFTHDEIREFIRFYETPAGQKLGSSMPALAQESMTDAMGRGQALVKRMIERLRTGGYLKT